MAEQTEARKFLHDISSPLTTVQLNLENAISILNDKKPGELDTALELLGGCLAQLKKASNLLDARRKAVSGSEENK